MGRRKMRKQEKNVTLKEFWRDNERFADLFNGVAFEGEEVLKPEMLQEMDTDMSGIIQMENYEESIVRIRDVVKKTAMGIDFVVLGIENQQGIHYAMPLRTLLYDGLGYLKEYNEIAAIRKEGKGKKTSGEFLSKMLKEDRLHPILTIIIYYGEIPWDGPTCLKDMIVEMPEKIEKVFSDYKMNLVQVVDSGKYIFHNEDVKTVFEISRDIFQDNFENIRRNYGERDIAPELAKVIGTITDSQEIIKQAENKEETNMCKSLERLKEEGRMEGRNQVIEIIKLYSKGTDSQAIAETLGLIPEYVDSVIVDYEKE